ncbi:CoA-binding protein [Aquimarina pacifica]|uniref:CoA-binding protein n=1 Tax=Aquimarina pacifica TaxID=1296415 RepID=UPI000472D75F|nr:CoA-binding protein [Aquimarina pacifica]
MNNKTLVLGASLKEKRYSNLVIHRLVHYGHSVVAVGLREGEVAGVRIQSNIETVHNIHTITLYLNPSRQVHYYDQILRLRPVQVIFNPGTENPELYALLKEENIDVEIACTLVLLSTNQY